MFKLRRARSYVETTRLLKIARRYFVMNAFDGALTMLGVLVGAYMSGNPNMRVIMSAGVAGSMAMGISGMAGAYMTERAERQRELKKLEMAMLTNLDDTLQGDASQFASVFTALVDGVSPALAAMIILSPFLLVRYSLLSMSQAFKASIIITGLELFGLGAYLAKISGESKLRYGIQMVLVGCLTAFMGFVVAMVLGQVPA